MPGRPGRTASPRAARLAAGALRAYRGSARAPEAPRGRRVARAGALSARPERCRGACAPRCCRGRRDRGRSRGAEPARGGLGRRALPCGALPERRRLVTRNVRRRRPLRYGLFEVRGARQRGAGRARLPDSDIHPRPHVRLPLRRGARARRLRRRCSSGWSTTTCSSSPSTISDAGIATTTSSGRCFRPSSATRARARGHSQSEGSFMVRGERPARGGR